MGARLVRDYVGQIPWDREEMKQHLRPVHDDQEHKALLRLKLEEEVAELLAARSEAEMVDELVDIYEVLEAFVDQHHISREDIAQRQANKYQERGGFLTGVVLEI